MASKRDLLNIKGMSEAKVDKILQAGRQLCNMDFMTGQQFARIMEQKVYITTGSRALDAILGQGIESESITELYGEFRTGKTQICHTLAITAQFSREMGGGAGKVAYIDTEGTFRPDRIRQIADHYGIDSEVALENISYGRAYNSEQQCQLLVTLAALMAETHYSIVIVDSATALFRSEFTGRGELCTRQINLNKFMRMLRKLADEFKVAVLITNQVVAQVDGAAMFAGDQKKPIGGHILAHASTVRVALRKGRGENRVAKVVDSPFMPEAEAEYCITAGGVTDSSG